MRWLTMYCAVGWSAVQRDAGTCVQGFATDLSDLLVGLIAVGGADHVELVGCVHGVLWRAGCEHPVAVGRKH
eukprot:5995589-Prymnesium_polylepis.1